MKTLSLGAAFAASTFLLAGSLTAQELSGASSFPSFGIAQASESGLVNPVNWLVDSDATSTGADCLVEEEEAETGCGSDCNCFWCRDPWTLPQPEILASHGIQIGGWLEQGISFVANNPADRYNGQVVYNNRDGEYMMNQLWFFMEREVDTGGCGFDLGGRVDVLYGTDAVHTQAWGWEDRWNQQERFYQVALPQMYLDVAWNDLTVRMGHFYTIIGYEGLMSPENIFYSHPYAFQFAEPFTHVGMLASYQLTDQISLQAGFHRGWDVWEDLDGLDRLGFLGGIDWTSSDELTTLTFAITAGEEGTDPVNGDNSTVGYSVVFTQMLTDQLQYVAQHDAGTSTGGDQVARKVEWYGLNQYLLYEVNEKWAINGRFEWFRDDDGAAVEGPGDGNANVGPFVGNFYEATLGLTWRPKENIIFRPEVRWDWYDADTLGGPRPYDAGDMNHQFLVGCDLTVTF